MTEQPATTRIGGPGRLGYSRRTPWPQPPVPLRSREGRVAQRPNNAFKPKLHRYAVHMAEKACHVASYALQFGLT